MFFESVFSSPLMPGCPTVVEAFDDSNVKLLASAEPFLSKISGSEDVQAEWCCQFVALSDFTLLVGFSYAVVDVFANGTVTLRMLVEPVLPKISQSAAMCDEHCGRFDSLRSFPMLVGFFSGKFDVSNI